MNKIIKIQDKGKIEKILSKLDFTDVGLDKEEILYEFKNIFSEDKVFIFNYFKNNSNIIVISTINEQYLFKSEDIIDLFGYFLNIFRTNPNNQINNEIVRRISTRIIEIKLHSLPMMN